jgi:transposase-like protein
MAELTIKCPSCSKQKVAKYGFSFKRKQRYICRNNLCKKNTFILDYSNKGWLPEVKHKILQMAINGSGIRDTVRVLGVGMNTVIKQLKKNKQTSKRR